MQKPLIVVTLLIVTCLIIFIVIFLSFPFSSALASPPASDRNQLAHIVDTQCLPNFHHKHSPWPCSHVDLAQDYVIMQDIKGSGHYLLIATSPVPGIESTALLSDASPRYFKNAWQHRSLVAATRGTHIDDQDIGILVNPLSLRTQDRLHLHIAPLHQPFSRVLKQLAAKNTAAWTTLMWEGRAFHVWKISEQALAHDNLLALITQRPMKAPPDMLRTAILLTGAGKNARGENELYVIEMYFPQRPEDGWFPEDLLDWRSAPVAIRRDQSAGA